MVNSIFQDVQGLHPARRAYNFSSSSAYTACLGELVPIYFLDLIPNSSFYLRTHALIRFTPLVAPIMDNVDYYVHYWQAPRRILEGDQFTEMITGETPDDEIDLPYFTPRNVYVRLLNLAPDDAEFIVGNGSLFDMFGYDRSLFLEGITRKLNSRKFIFYARLIVEWYTNENVEPWRGCFDELNSWANPKVNLQGDISDEIAIFAYRIYITFGSRFFGHAYPKDYFTGALPTLQYGEPTYLPLGTSAPVTIEDTNASLETPRFIGRSVDMSGVLNLNSAASYAGEMISVNGSFNKGVDRIDGNLTAEGEVDLSEATAITINELRLTNAIQVFKEREMRFGRRAPEYYKGFYGVKPRDMRLQLPEYIGGGRMPINISDIEQMSQTTESSPQGNLSGKGTGIAGGFATAKCFVPEESCVIGIAWAMPRISYAQLLSRHDVKLNDRFEYFNPSFVHIGEQEVYRWEIYAGHGDEDILGYQPRFTEYRFKANEIHGQFKDSLQFWTLARNFQDAPNYNADLIYMKPSNFSRIFAVETDTDGRPYPNMLVSLKFSVSLIQPLSRYGTPSLIV